MESTIQIGNRTVGSERPTYIIAEIGINHNGDLALARRLIDVAAEAKVDAVKFQKRHLPSLYREDVLTDTLKYEQHFQYMIPILKQVEISEEEYPLLKGYTEERGIEFLCTPFDVPSADFLAGLGVKAFKIASADLTNLALLEHVASFGKPMLVSTGMSYWEEIEKAVELLKAMGVPFALLHCRSVYPVWPREVNLRMINRLSGFGCPVGYSGHDMGITVPLVAASMGASIVEKHITLDRKMPGPDHKISLEPYELKRLVRDIRVADQAMGKSRRFLMRGEILNRELFAKSLMAAEDIPAGAPITRDMITVQGPGKGLAPIRIGELVGRDAVRDMKRGDFFLDEDVDGPCTLDFHNSFRTRWGLICRFNDFQDMLPHRPKVIEFHLAEKDFNLGFRPAGSHEQELVVHTPEYIDGKLFDLCSGSEEVRSASVGLLRKTLDLCKLLEPHFQGTPKVIVHPGAMSLNAKLNENRLRETLLRSLSEVKSNGAELLLENLPPYPWYFGGQWKGNYFMDAEGIRSFCEETGIGICLDLSHAALYCNAKGKDLSAFVRALLPHTRHIHFADAYGLDGEGVAIGEGDIDFDAIMPLFAEYQGTWVPEIWRGHLQNGKGFLQALIRLRQYDI
ncbi:MAG: N-acetylneuraminate synthase family protein [Deltaproteobacteria bacterium]|nr:N-acetylneuraminate synthase family protein [Deltaproteobacteria bacterium]